MARSRWSRRFWPTTPVISSAWASRFVDGAVLLDPLDRGLLADLVDADQVVAGLADQGGDLGILRGLDAVALAHRVGVVGLELGDPADVRVEHRHVVGDELEGVAVAGCDEHAEPLGRAPRREGGEDVVGLEVLFGEDLHAHRAERLLQQRDLPLELGRGLAAGALVLRVLARAERLPRDVERDREVGRLLLLEQQEQHRDEAVDRVGVLAVAGREAVDRQGVEGPECERMAVDEQKGRLFGVRHGLSLSAGSDTPTDTIATDLDDETAPRHPAGTARTTRVPEAVICPARWASSSSS